MLDAFHLTWTPLDGLLVRPGAPVRVFIRPDDYTYRDPTRWRVARDIEHRTCVSRCEQEQRSEYRPIDPYRRSSETVRRTSCDLMTSTWIDR